jgi:glycosyltransferase involved in cell wall biosynthesis
MMKNKQAEKQVLVIDAFQCTADYNYCFLNALVKKGGNIIYATTEFPFKKAFFPAEVKIRYCFFYLARVISRLTSSRKLRRTLRAIEYPINMVALLIYLLRSRIKVIHLMNTITPTFDYWAIRLMQKIGCHVVFTAHNPFPHEEKPSSVKRFSRIHNQVDHIIALTNFTRSEIIKYSGLSNEKITIIPHGDFACLHSQYPENKCLAEEILTKAKGRRVISFLGIIRPYKGLEYFIRAIPLIKSLKRDTFFLIAGSARFANQKQLEDLISQYSTPEDCYVNFCYFPISDMKAYLSVTDVLVQPYISASQSGNTAMAYSEGIPLVSTNVGGLAEMIANSRTGYVVPPKDPQAIANAVKKCFEEDNYVRMSKNARQFVMEKYNWDNIAAQTLTVYKNVIK